MRLFEPRGTLTRAEPKRASVETPLGTMAFEAVVGDGPLLTAETLVGKGGIEARRYSHPAAEIEILLFPLSPRIPEHLRVDACVAAVWRVHAQGGLPSVVLRAAWEPGARNKEGGREDGEYLVSLAWDAPNVRLSLGTADEEMLLATAERGEFLPRRLAPTYDALVPRLVEHADFARHERHLPRTVRERDGLELELPPLLAGEAAQVHFVVAWRTGAFDWQDVSTWYAVDVAPWEIARMADGAVGRLA